MFLNVLIAYWFSNTVRFLAIRAASILRERLLVRYQSIIFLPFWRPDVQATNTANTNNGPLMDLIKYPRYCLSEADNKMPEV
jgi:hypothetical protein